ncbi:formyltransferase family protein [Thermonema rossianum]|uniref:formyltransferase family protein n=1 Tax=Thermonema rossianum TaxID=55505 RepID=UPI00056E45BA|nr:formyltransferase family protein [Thermonema rossianum]
MKTVIFLGSKPIGYECLQHLFSRQDSLGIKVTAVFTNDNTRFDKNKSVRDLATSFGVPVYEDIAALETMAPVDVLISVQYHQILKKKHIQKAKQLAVNLHMAPLPEYRGCNQFSFAILDGAKEFGTTLHVMNEDIDGGDILFERRFPIPADVFVKELYQKTFEESLILFQEHIEDIIRGEYQPIAQSDRIPTHGTSIHYRNEVEQIKCINWRWPKEKIERHIRATSMPGFPPPYTYIAGKKIEFHLKED